MPELTPARALPAFFCPEHSDQVDDVAGEQRDVATEQQVLRRWAGGLASPGRWFRALPGGWRQLAHGVAYHRPGGTAPLTDPPAERCTDENMLLVCGMRLSRLASERCKSMMTTWENKKVRTESNSKFGYCNVLALRTPRRHVTCLFIPDNLHGLLYTQEHVWAGAKHNSTRCISACTYYTYFYSDTGADPPMIRITMQARFQSGLPNTLRSTASILCLYLPYGRQGRFLFAVLLLPRRHIVRVVAASWGYDAM